MPTSTTFRILARIVLGPNKKKISVFRVTGLKIKAGKAQIFVSNYCFCISPFKIHKFIVNELYSLFLKFSALGLLQDIRNNFHS